MNDIFLNDIKNHLSQVILLENIDIKKFYQELFSFFSETQEQYIMRKHIELKNLGYKNKEIYQLISNSCKEMLFRGKLLTQRQIKRIIYKE